MLHIPYLPNYGYHVQQLPNLQTGGMCSPPVSMSPSPPASNIVFESGLPANYAATYQQFFGKVAQVSQKKMYGKSFMIDSILGLTNQQRPYDLSIGRDSGSGVTRIRPDSHRDVQTSVLGKRNSSEKSGKTTKKSSEVGKPKRIRTIFTPEQLERLESEFERQQYMVGPERVFLASTLNLTEAQVKVWFQNRRIKWRKQHLELEQAQLAKLRNE